MGSSQSSKTQTHGPWGTSGSYGYDFDDSVYTVVRRINLTRAVGSLPLRLERIFNFGCHGAIRGLGCLMGSRRIVIGQDYAMSIMEIDDEEPIVSKGDDGDFI